MKKLFIIAKWADNKMVGYDEVIGEVRSICPGFQIGFRGCWGNWKVIELGTGMMLFAANTYEDGEKHCKEIITAFGIIQTKEYYKTAKSAADEYRQEHNITLPFKEEKDNG